MSEFAPMFWFAAAIVAYFLPAIVGSYREHKSASAIVVVNLFLGWTLLGWVVALAWAYADDGKQRA